MISYYGSIKIWRILVLNLTNGILLELWSPLQEGSAPVNPALTEQALKLPRYKSVVPKWRPDKATLCKLYIFLELVWSDSVSGLMIAAMLLLTKRSNCLLHRMQKVCKNGFLLQPIDPNRKLLRCPRNKLSLRSGNHFFILLVSKLRSTSCLKEPFIDDVIGFFLVLKIPSSVFVCFFRCQTFSWERCFNGRVINIKLRVQQLQIL